jgi:hypothetical protein
MSGITPLLAIRVRNGMPAVLLSVFNAVVKVGYVPDNTLAATTTPIMVIASPIVSSKKSTILCPLLPVEPY